MPYHQPIQESHDPPKASERGEIAMRVLVEDYDHRTGEHCASTALRNILRFHGTEISEPMIIGLAGGIGFFYLSGEEISPSRMFHGRTFGLESDFCENANIPFEDVEEPDDDRAWAAVRERIDAGIPVMLSTDTFYLGYHHTTSHFPGHRLVLVGYDDASREVYLADRKFDELVVCGYEELRRARNSNSYPIPCRNQYGDFRGAMRLGRPLVEAIRIAMRRNAEWMLLRSPEALTGIAAMRKLSADLPGWAELEDWSWASRFGYQVVIKRGAGGSFFRSLYADFLEEAAARVPEINAMGLPKRMQDIAAGWRDLASVLKDQSERNSCDPALFTRAGGLTAVLADREEAFFEQQLSLALDDSVWSF